MRGLALTTAILLGAAALCPAQAPARPGVLASWSFDDTTEGWQSADPQASATITDDANLTRGEEGGAVLEYAYTPQPGKLAGLLVQVEPGLGAAKGLRFWLRTSEPAVILTVLTEKDQSSYNTAFYSLAGRWQEVALDLSEFRLGDDSTDENDRLDPDQIEGIGIVDATGFLAQLVETVPFLQPPDMGARLLWLDDVSVGSETVPPRWAAAQIDGKRAVRLDSFEYAPLQWVALAGKGAELEYDPDFRAEGKQSLRLRYDLAPGKLFGVLTSPQGPDLQGLNRLRMWVMSEVATTLIVGLKERDGSQYNHMAELAAGDKLELLDLELTVFELSDDSTDENARLDLDQVTELTVADISALAGKPVTVNTLWLDDVAFTE